MKKNLALFLSFTALLLSGCSISHPSPKAEIVPQIEEKAIQQWVENNVSWQELVKEEWSILYKNEKYGFEARLPEEFKDYHVSEMSTGNISFALQKPNWNKNSLKTSIPWLSDDYIDVMEIRCHTLKEYEILTEQKEPNDWVKANEWLRESSREYFLWRNNHYYCNLFISIKTHAILNMARSREQFMMPTRIIRGFSISDIELEDKEDQDSTTTIPIEEIAPSKKHLYSNKKYGLTLQLPQEFDKAFVYDNNEGEITFSLKAPNSSFHAKENLPQGYKETLKIRCYTPEEYIKFENITWRMGTNIQDFLWKNNHYYCNFYLHPYINSFPSLTSWFYEHRLRTEIIRGSSMNDI